MNMPLFVLGVGWVSRDASAALIHDGKFDRSPPGGVADDLFSAQPLEILSRATIAVMRVAYTPQLA